MARLKKWRGKEIAQAVGNNVGAALVEMGLRVEGHAKKELRRGHGVLTGTLRRSIHIALPGYNWAGDNVQPEKGSPERGRQIVKPITENGRITVQVGSGLNYALPVHQGHHSFIGYHYLSLGVLKVKREVAALLRKHQLK